MPELYIVVLQRSANSTRYVLAEVAESARAAIERAAADPYLESGGYRAFVHKFAEADGIDVKVTRDVRIGEPVQS